MSHLRYLCTAQLWIEGKKEANSQINCFLSSTGWKVLVCTKREYIWQFTSIRYLHYLRSWVCTLWKLEFPPSPSAHHEFSSAKLTVSCTALFYHLISENKHSPWVCQQTNTVTSHDFEIERILFLVSSRSRSQLNLRAALQKVSSGKSQNSQNSFHLIIYYCALARMRCPNPVLQRKILWNKNRSTEHYEREMSGEKMVAATVMWCFMRWATASDRLMDGTNFLCARQYTYSSCGRWENRFSICNAIRTAVSLSPLRVRRP